MRKLKDIFKRQGWIHIYLFTSWLCLRNIFKLNLGDQVIYENQIYTLIQGVQDPYWTLSRMGDRVEGVHKNHFKKVINLDNVIHDIKFTWKFYSGYWHNIWINHSGGDRISKMQSWGSR